MTDHNCFIGKWPFYRLDGSFSSLCEEHAQSGVTNGYVSSLESVFYNDFYESERELYTVIKNSSYKHTVIPNPRVQGCEITLERCLDEFDVQGIRLVPGYHGYSLSDDRLESIINQARINNLPIFINARLTDERMTHILHPAVPTAEEIADFLNRAEGVRVVLCYLKDHEADAVFKKCKDKKNLFFDVSGMTGSLLDNTPEYINRCVLGTCFPLRTVRSSVMRIERELNCELQNEILNAKI